MGRMRRVTAASSATRQQKPPAKQSKQAKKIVQSDLGASKRVSTCSPGGEKPRDLEFENSQFYYNKTPWSYADIVTSRMSFLFLAQHRATAEVWLNIVCIVAQSRKSRFLPLQFSISTVTVSNLTVAVFHFYTCNFPLLAYICRAFLYLQFSIFHFRAVFSDVSQFFIGRAAVVVCMNMFRKNRAPAARTKYTFLYMQRKGP